MKTPSPHVVADMLKTVYGDEVITFSKLFLKESVYGFDDWIMDNVLNKHNRDVSSLSDKELKKYCVDMEHKLLDEIFTIIHS